MNLKDSLKSKNLFLTGLLSFCVGLIFIFIVPNSASGTDLINEDFEHEGAAPDGWIVNGIDFVSGTSTSHSHPYAAKFDLHADYLITPQLTYPQTMTYWMYATAGTSSFTIEQSSSTDGPWTALAESPITTEYGSYKQESFDLSSYSNIYIKLRRSYSRYYYLDDLVVTEDATSPVVTNAQITNAPLYHGDDITLYYDSIVETNPDYTQFYYRIGTDVDPNAKQGWTLWTNNDDITNPPAHTFDVSAGGDTLENGDRVEVCVRHYDKTGNNGDDFTTYYVQNTTPTVSITPSSTNIIGGATWVEVEPECTINDVDDGASGLEIKLEYYNGTSWITAQDYQAATAEVVTESFDTTPGSNGGYCSKDPVSGTYQYYYFIIEDYDNLGTVLDYKFRATVRDTGELTATATTADQIVDQTVPTFNDGDFRSCKEDEATWIATSEWNDTQTPYCRVTYQDAISGARVQAEETNNSYTLGLWHFNDNLNDETGAHNAAWAQGGGSYVAGRHGNAVLFDGNDGLSTTGDVNDADHNYLVSGCWIYLTENDGTTTRTILQDGDTTHGFWLQLNNGGTNISFRIYASDTEAKITADNTDNSLLPLNTWHWIVCRFYGGDDPNYMHMWVDSSLAASASGGTIPDTVPNPGTAFYIGYSAASGNTEYFKGRIDEVKFRAWWIDPSWQYRNGGQYQYSTDGGSNWSAWNPCDTSGSSGSTDTQTVTTHLAVPFNQNHPTNNQIKFRNWDSGQNLATTSAYTVQIDNVTPNNPAIQCSSDATYSHDIPENTWQTDGSVYWDWDWTDQWSATYGYYEYNTDSGNTIGGTEDYIENDDFGSINPYTLTEGTRYFHVKSKSGAGKWGAEDVFIIKYDGTNPSPGTVTLSTPSDYLYADDTNDKLYYSDEMGSTPQTFTVSGTGSDTGGSEYKETSYASAFGDSPATDSGTAWSADYTVVDTDTGDSTITITGHDNAGNSGTSSINYYEDTTSPNQVTSPSAVSAGKTRIRLTWAAIADDSQSGFRKYTVYYDTDSGTNRGDYASSWTTADDANLATRTTAATIVTGLAADQTYYFRIGAEDRVTNLNTLSSEVSAQTLWGTRDVAINEVAWSGTCATYNDDEWVELYNNRDFSIYLGTSSNGWKLYEGGGATLIEPVFGTIGAHTYWLIERTNDNTVSDVAASQTPGSWGGSGLGNTGENLVLKDTDGNSIDIVDCSGGWFAGTASTQYRTMERKDPNADGSTAGNWASNDMVTRNGLAEDGTTAINGTPKQPNSAFGNISPSAKANDITGADDPLYAGTQYSLTAVYSDGDGYSDLADMYLKIVNPSATDIIFYAPEAGATGSGSATVSDGGDYLDGTPTYSYSSSGDRITLTWTFTLDYDWTESVSIEYGVYCTDDSVSDSGGYSTTNIDVQYENDLVFADSITFTGATQGLLSDGDWVKGSEAITVTGTTVVYEGSSVHPPDADFNVDVTTDGTPGPWNDDDNSEGSFSVEAAGDTITNASGDTYTVTIADVPSGCTAASYEWGIIKTDADNPTVTIESITSDHPAHLYEASAGETYYFRDDTYTQTLTLPVAVTDGESGDQKVTFEAGAFGDSPDEDTTGSPYSTTGYTIDLNYGADESIMVTGYDNVSNTTSDTVNFTRDVTAPTDVSDLAVNATTQSSVTLTWSAVTEGGSGFKGYTIYYNTAGSVTRSDTPWSSTNDTNLATPDTTHTTITGLSNNQQYFFRIGAEDNVSNQNTLSNEVDTTTTTDPGAGDVVINEMMWMGSSGHGANDEWIELYNTTANAIDLSDWQLTKNEGEETLMFTIPSGTTIPSGEYLLITEFNAANSEIADISYGLSSPFSSVIVGTGSDNNADFVLSDTLLQIKLKDDASVLIDTAGDGSTPLAGDAGTYASMERKTPPGDGASGANWQTATTQVNLDCPDLGTPGAQNSGGEEVTVTITNWRELY